MKSKKKRKEICTSRLKGNVKCGKPTVFGKNYCQDHRPAPKVTTYSIGETKFEGKKTVKSSQYEVYLQSEAWTQKSRREREKNPNCSFCNRKGVLHVHHRTYVRLGEEKEGDLVVVCSDCHDIFHQYYKYDSRVGHFTPK